MVHFPSHHPARYPPPVQFPVRILPLERLPKMVGIITHFLIDYGNSHSKLLGGQQIQQSHESYPLSGGRHDIQYAFKKEKIKAPCYRKLYISWNIRYISTFPSVWVYSPVFCRLSFLQTKEISRDYCPATFYHPCSRL